MSKYITARDVLENIKQMQKEDLSLDNPVEFHLGDAIFVYATNTGHFRVVPNMTFTLEEDSNDGEEDIYAIIGDKNCVETYNRTLLTALHSYSKMCDISDEDTLEKLIDGSIRYKLMTIDELKALPELDT